MSKDTDSSLLIVVMELKRHFLSALHEQDKEQMIRLRTTFGVLEDICVDKGIVELARIFGYFRDSISNYLMGVKFKMYIPSDEDIEIAVNPPKKQ